MTTAVRRSTVRRVVHHPHHAAYGAAGRSGSAAAVSLLFLVVAAGVVTLLVFLARASAKGAAARRAALQAAFQAHLDAVMKMPLTPIAVPELSLASGEIAYYSAQAQVLGTHTRTRRVGYGGGPSFRIARGVYWHASSYTSTPVRESFTATDDAGTLVVTNERVIFVGQRNSFSWPLSKRLSIERFTDGVRINPINHRAVVFTTGSEDAGIIIDRARAGSLAKMLGSAPN